mmetsp:Transcript_14195/g.34466  ORF Transcript_14195/g.34466 Transcript_14195/m.34466 type:complete len:117 (+) Transcript_14195:275-625(+)
MQLPYAERKANRVSIQEHRIVTQIINNWIQFIRSRSDKRHPSSAPRKDHPIMTADTTVEYDGFHFGIASRFGSLPTRNPNEAKHTRCEIRWIDSRCFESIRTISPNEGNQSMGIEE